MLETWRRAGIDVSVTHTVHAGLQQGPLAVADGSACDQLESWQSLRSQQWRAFDVVFLIGGEIRERRVHFLRHVVRRLDLGCVIERRKIEEPLVPRFDFALLRAVAPPELSLELARPWVVPAGEVWIWAGPGAESPPGVRVERIALDSGGQILRLSAG